jgi:hypothetical protein
LPPAAARDGQPVRRPYARASPAMKRPDG